MTTYRNIHGRSIQAVTTDPTESVAEGQVWYNTTSDTFKSIVATEAWVSASPLITGVYGSMQFGLQTAGVAASGSAGPGPTTATQEYNGSGWSSGGNVGSQRYRGGAGGTETAGVIFGGESPGGDSTATEEYDGSSWTNGGAMTKARRTTGVGIQTAASAVGGYDNANKLATVEDYNGTSWTSGTNLPLSGTIDSGSGLTSSARVAGGIFGPGSTHPPSSPQTFNNNLGWDGTSWSDDTAIPVNRYNNSGFGTSSDDYYTAGGRNPSPATLNTTIQWNGSAWSSAPNLATARYNGQGINGTPSAFYFAGGNPGEYTNTEEFTASANVITAGAWASGGTIPDSKRDGYKGSIGTQTAGIAFGGEPLNSEAYLYDGSTWTDSGATMGTNVRTGAGMGTQTAAGNAGGNASVGYSATGAFQTFDGSSWSEQPDLNTSRSGCAGAGTTTAALVSSGTSTSNTIVGNTEEYNGSSWSEQNDVGTARYYFTGCGTQTAGLIFGGTTTTPSPFTPTTNTEEYDGTNWTAGGALITALGVHGAAGTQTAALGFGGTPGISGGAGSGYQHVQGYDGTAWSSRPSMSDATSAFRGTGGTSTAAYAAGGYNSSGSNIGTTEDFTGESSVLNVKTLTQS